MPLFSLALLALVLGIVLHLVALRVFPAFGLLDFPERYGFKRGRLPYPTGVIAVLVFLLFYAALEPSSTQKTGVMAGILLLGAFSFTDDRRPLPSLLRLGIHVLVAFIIFSTGSQIYTLTHPFGFLETDIIKLDALRWTLPYLGAVPVFSALFTIFWLGLTINALNWFDGIPGQVTSLSTIGFLTLGFLALSSRVNQPHFALLALVLAGIAGASLLFDFPPPRVVSGDTGAMFFGLMLGVLSTYSGGKVATAFLVLGVPLIDLFLVIVRRLAKGASIFRGDAKSEHLHHRLLRKGWSPRSIVLLTTAIGTGFGLAALFLSTAGKFVAAGILFLVMLGLSWYSRPHVQ